jgi:hypothetical protein
LILSFHYNNYDLQKMNLQDGTKSKHTREELQLHHSNYLALNHQQGVTKGKKRARVTSSSPAPCSEQPQPDQNGRYQDGFGRDIQFGVTKVGG